MDVPSDIRGIPKSGRVWKDPKKRFSSMVQSKSLKSSWSAKVKLRDERKTIMAQVAELKKENEKIMEIKKKKRRARIERKKENERKSEIVQVIRNPAKIKKMSRRQLRQVEKRDTDLPLYKKKN